MSFEERCNESDFFDMEIGLRVHIRACYAEIDRLTYELKVTEGIAGARELDLAELKAKPSLPEQGVKEAVEALEGILDLIERLKNKDISLAAWKMIEKTVPKTMTALNLLRTQPVPTPTDGGK